MVNTVLCTYTGEFVTVVGECRLAVEYSGFKCSSPAVVISGEGPCLMGRNWLQHISLNWSEIFHLATVYTDLNEMLETHSSIFQEGLSKVEGVKGKFMLTLLRGPDFLRPDP